MDDIARSGNYELWRRYWNSDSSTNAIHNAIKGQNLDIINIYKEKGHGLHTFYILKTLNYKIISSLLGYYPWNSCESIISYSLIFDF